MIPRGTSTEPLVPIFRLVDGKIVEPVGNSRPSGFSDRGDTGNESNSLPPIDIFAEPDCDFPEELEKQKSDDSDETRRKRKKPKRRVEVSSHFRSESPPLQLQEDYDDDDDDDDDFEKYFGKKNPLVRGQPKAETSSDPDLLSPRKSHVRRSSSSSRSRKRPRPRPRRSRTRSRASRPSQKRQRADILPPDPDQEALVDLISSCSSSSLSDSDSHSDSDCEEDRSHSPQRRRTRKRDLLYSPPPLKRRRLTSDFLGGNRPESPIEIDSFSDSDSVHANPNHGGLSTNSGDVEVTEFDDDEHALSVHSANDDDDDVLSLSDSEKIVFPVLPSSMHSLPTSVPSVIPRLRCPPRTLTQCLELRRLQRTRARWLASETDFQIRQKSKLKSEIDSELESKSKMETEMDFDSDDSRTPLTLRVLESPHHSQRFSVVRCRHEELNQDVEVIAWTSVVRRHSKLFRIGSQIQVFLPYQERFCQVGRAQIRRILFPFNICGMIGNLSTPPRRQLQQLRPSAKLHGRGVSSDKPTRSLFISPKRPSLAPETERPPLPVVGVPGGVENHSLSLVVGSSALTRPDIPLDCGCSPPPSIHSFVVVGIVQRMLSRAYFNFLLVQVLPKGEFILVRCSDANWRKEILAFENRRVRISGLLFEGTQLLVDEDMIPTFGLLTNVVRVYRCSYTARIDPVPEDVLIPFAYVPEHSFGSDCFRVEVSGELLHVRTQKQGMMKDGHFCCVLYLQSTTTSSNSNSVVRIYVSVVGACSALYSAVRSCPEDTRLSVRIRECRVVDQTSFVLDRLSLVEADALMGGGGDRGPQTESHSIPLSAALSPFVFDGTNIVPDAIGVVKFQIDSILTNRLKPFFFGCRRCRYEIEETKVSMSPYCPSCLCRIGSIQGEDSGMRRYLKLDILGKSVTVEQSRDIEVRLSHSCIEMVMNKMPNSLEATGTETFDRAGSKFRGKICSFAVVLSNFHSEDQTWVLQAIGHWEQSLTAQALSLGSLIT